MTKWLTLEEFQRLGDKCKICEKPATCLPLDGTWDCYCDEHWPQEREKEEEK